MADENDGTERSEDPTQKRRDDAQARGDVVKSQEVNTFFVIGGALLALFAFAGPAMQSLSINLSGLIAKAHLISAQPSGLIALAQQLGLQTLAAIALPLLVLVLAAIGGNLVQHQLVWSAESLKPKLNRISPIAGAKRIFGKQAFVNLLKGLAKLAVVGTIMVWLFWPERYRLGVTIAASPAGTLRSAGDLALKMLAATAAVLALVAAADYLYQYRVWFARQKMSLRELKEEFKQTEGDPAIKGRLRELRQARMRKRMMANVPKASVIITNPTHFAVALQYEKGMNAPVCVAKGVDAIAMRIREVGGQHNIPLVENPPLARALHATAEVDQEIPAEHYKAVAEVIGYIMRLNASMRR
ncbi:MAG: flagellar biosynthesis protein FlhB [Variibacter sp.]|jgi:flagellar biosynthetic protein FlhB|nr:flagellar biosynthesis protein FlhB [Variibacter sp.]